MTETYLIRWCGKILLFLECLDEVLRSFKVGDKVAVLDEPLQGVVTAISGNQVTLATDDGFPLQFEITQLVKVQDDIVVSNYQVAEIKASKAEQKRKRVTPIKKKARNAPKMEVDLHIHHLTPSTKGMTNFDMLNLQLATAKRQLEFAIKKRIQKVVFIHGIGEGVLKEELHYLFKRYDIVKYYDADYQKYGLGATEVYIHQNP